MTNDETFEFGDIIRLSDEYHLKIPDAFIDTRLMVVDGHQGVVVQKHKHDVEVGDICAVTTRSCGRRSNDEARPPAATFDPPEEPSGRRQR